LPALHHLYLTSYSGNVVTVIDTVSASVLTTIPVEGPGYLGVVPDASSPPPPPPNDGPKPAPLVPGPRPQRPIVAPRHAIGWIN
jgi:YVTN family beta-propeller protein